MDGGKLNYLATQFHDRKKDLRMGNVIKNFSKEESMLLLEKGTAPGWWNKEVHKIVLRFSLT